MISLPIEVQLYILKYLNFNELISVKQTNSYFCNLISKYERELARRKFYSFSLKNKNELYSDNVIDLPSSNFKLNLTDQLKEKWEAAIDKSTRLFSHSSKKLFICMSQTDDRNSPYYILKLPNLPNNFKQMIIIRYWLEQLFKCDFEYCNFGTVVFNPEMINILFDNDKTISLQFNIECPTLIAGKKTFRNVLKFYLNHLSNSEYLKIVLYHVDITEHRINILFNIMINKGNKKFLKISAECYEIAKLCDLIIEHIITSKDCSNMVPKITLWSSYFPDFKLNERAENVEIDDSDDPDIIYTRYQIANIYNPKVRFSFENVDIAASAIYYIDIRKMEE
uniref:F-box domain-containing protein n=1 Tax=Meloidogyne incognita TaxID=6306 RepID=A0A914MW12_MELIC